MSRNAERENSDENDLAEKEEKEQNENVKNAPRFRYPHTLIFQLLKAAGIGALAGLGLVVVNEVFSKRSKIIINKYHGRLPIRDLEGLGEEAELCGHFHMMNVKQFRAQNSTAYDVALTKCSDLCFLAESIANGTLDDFVPQIKAGKLDPFTDLSYDTEALNLWYEIHDNLQILYNSVRDSESKKVEARDKLEEQYKHDLAQYENDLVNWLSRKLQVESESLKTGESGDMFDFMKKSEPLSEKIVFTEPQPQKPKELVSEKLRSDFAEDCATAIDNRTRKVFIYIRDTLDRFRRKYGQLPKRKKSKPMQDEQELTFENK
jgi:hypothetical protein